MKTSVWALFLSTVLLLWGCGGGGGLSGDCSGSAEYCAQYASGAGVSSIDSSPASAGLFSKTGTGDSVFDIPTGVTSVRIQGSFTGSSANFIVAIADKNVVNEIVGTTQFPNAYDGVLKISGGGAVAITNSSGVTWTMTEVKLAAAVVPSGIYTSSGTGDAVFNLPARVAKVRIQGGYLGSSTNFIVGVSGKNFVNEIIGQSRLPQTYDGTLSITAGGTVEITRSSGVNWTFTEVQ